jgi:hypothetical protein
MLRRSRFLFLTPHSSPQQDLLSILSEAIPAPSSSRTKTKEKRSTKSPLNSRNVSSSPTIESIYQNFSLVSPKAQPANLPYLCPPKWVNLVADTIESHFNFQIAPSSSTNAAETKTINKKAPRPELFLQSFVHPSFIRDFERRKFQQQQQQIQSQIDETKNHNEEQDEMPDSSMDSLAEVGQSILQYSLVLFSSLMPVPSSSSLSSSQNSATNKDQQKENLIDFSVFPVAGEFVISMLKASEINPEEKLTMPEQLSVRHFSSFASKTFASPQVSATNQKTLTQAVTSDHNLSLVSFNVWKVSDLVLTDAGIFGLRDASKASTREKLNIPPLPMPAAAMNVKAVVGAVYLNFGLEEAVKFCQKHVIPHAVNMMPK